MPIPNADTAYVPPEKLTGYLLNEQHPVGGSKASWFLGLGYDAANPISLEEALLLLVRTSNDYSEQKSPYGTKYVVSGRVAAPDGTAVNVMSVWIVEPGDDRPRLVTAYPGEQT